MIDLRVDVEIRAIEHEANKASLFGALEGRKAGDIGGISAAPPRRAGADERSAVLLRKRELRLHEAAEGMKSDLQHRAREMHEKAFELADLEKQLAVPQVRPAARNNAHYRPVRFRHASFPGFQASSRQSRVTPARIRVPRVRM